MEIIFLPADHRATESLNTSWLKEPLYLWSLAFVFLFPPQKLKVVYKKWIAGSNLGRSNTEGATVN